MTWEISDLTARARVGRGRPVTTTPVVATPGVINPERWADALLAD